MKWLKLWWRVGVMMAAGVVLVTVALLMDLPMLLWKALTGRHWKD